MAEKFFHRGLRRLFAVMVGTVFFISGSFKIMDPVGTGLIVEEYLKFFKLTFLVQGAMWLGFVLAVVETLIGMLMMFGIWRKFSSCLSATVLLFFTLITAVLLIFNPEMECGCFGEAVHLTHLQSFLKNVVLCAMTAVVIFPVGDLGKPMKRKYAGFGLVCAGVIAFSIYSQTHTPLIDFTRFKPGNELLSVHGDGFDYVEDGEEFVQDESVSVLSVSDAFGEYQDALLTEGNVIIASVYAPEKMGQDAWGQVSAVLQNAQLEGILPVLLCSSMDYVPVELSDLVYFADYKDIITLNRSNGGSTFISEGRIIQKWGWRQMPVKDRMDEMLREEPVEVMMAAGAHKRYAFQGYLLYTFALMLFL